MQITYNRYFLYYSILSMAHIGLKDVTNELKRRCYYCEDIVTPEPLKNISLIDLCVIEAIWSDCAAIALCIENAIELDVSPELLYELYKMPY